MEDIKIAERIHEAALSLLADPGIQIEHDPIRELMCSHGAKTGKRGGSVCIPAGMIADTLERCPRTVELTDRNGTPIRLAATSDSSIWSTPGINWNHRGEHRPFTTHDMADYARLLDRLETVDVVFGMALEDVPPPFRDIVGLRTIATNSSKHIRALCFSPEGATAMTRMRDVIGNHPWFSIGFTSHGPLRWTHLALEIFARTAGHGIPATINGEPMAGISGPVSIAGAAAVGNAEILAGLVINQLLEPGRPCIYNLGLAHAMDMRTAIALTGAPENALFAKLSALMGRFYDLPSCSWVSTEAMTVDAQAAMEKMFGFTTHLQEGVSAIWGVGQLESQMTVSPAMAVIDDEMIRYARHYQQGVPADDEALALEVTREVGIAGSFLDHNHTLAHFRQTLFDPHILWRRTREQWAAGGSKDLAERAETEADKLMADEPRQPLSSDQGRELQAITDGVLNQET